MSPRDILRPQDYLGDQILREYEGQGHSTHGYYPPHTVPDRNFLTGNLIDRHGRKRLCMESSSQANMDNMTLTCPTAGADSTRVGLLDFLNQHRKACLWSSMPAESKCHYCGQKSVDAKEWVSRDMMDVGQVAVIVFRNLQCTRDKKGCGKTFSNISSGVLSSLPAAQRSQLPCFLLEDDLEDASWVTQEELESGEDKQSTCPLVTKAFEAFLQAKINQGFSPEQIACSLNKAMRCSYETSKLQYYEFQRMTQSSIPCQNAPAPASVPFPEFTDADAWGARQRDPSMLALSWGGTVLSGQFIRNTIEASSQQRLEADRQSAQNIAVPEIVVDSTPEAASCIREASGLAPNVAVGQDEHEEISPLSDLSTQTVEPRIQSAAPAQDSPIQASAQQPTRAYSHGPGLHPFFSEVERHEGKGRGRGEGRTTCSWCSEVLKAELGLRGVPKLGHSCVLAMIYAGRDAASLPHCKQQYKVHLHEGMSREEAEKQLRRKLTAAIINKERKKRQFK